MTHIAPGYSTFFFSSRRRHTRLQGDWSSDVCSSDLGFAVVSTDAGHTGTTASFGADPQARLDHAYNAYDKTAVAAKSLISTRYGRKPEHSYFSEIGRASCRERV